MLDISSDQKNQNSAYIINLSGSIDSETSRDFESFFSEMISQGYRFFILESSRLKSMSNSGIAGLVQFLKKIENESGFVCFAALNYENHMLMDFCGISQKYPVFATLIEAENFIQQVMSDSAKDKTISNPVQPEIRDLYGNHGFSRGYNRKKDLHKETLQEFSAYNETKNTEVKDREFSEKRLSGMNIAPEDSIIECEQCSAVIRVYKSGKHMCPSCSIEFFVKYDGSVSYFEKLNK